MDEKVKNPTTEGTLNQKKITVLLVEDDLDTVFLFKNKIEEDDRLEYLGHASCKTSGINEAVKLNPDVVLMDLALSDYSREEGIDAAREIRLKTKAKILFLSVQDVHGIIMKAQKKASASGYIVKDKSENLTNVIYNTATSDTIEKKNIKELVLNQMSPAERDIFEKFLEGNNKAETYGPAQRTIDNQIRDAYHKRLGLNSRAEAIHIFENW